MIGVWVAQFSGWIGAACILLAFWLLVHKVVHSHSYTYLSLNIFGGLFLFHETFTHGVHASAALNIIWVAIAVYGLVLGHKRKDVKLKR